MIHRHLDAVAETLESFRARSTGRFLFAKVDCCLLIRPSADGLEGELSVVD